MADNNQPSTGNSMLESVTGKAQQALGNLTGNTGDQAKGELREDKAQAEYDASHATAKVPGATISGSGAAVTDNSDRSQGSWNQTMGSTKEALGGLVGNEVRSSPLARSLQHDLKLTIHSPSSKPAVSRTVRVRSRRPGVSSLTWATVWATEPRVPSAALSAG